MANKKIFELAFKLGSSIDNNLNKNFKSVNKNILSLKTSSDKLAHNSNLISSFKNNNNALQGTIKELREAKNKLSEFSKAGYNAKNASSAMQSEFKNINSSVNILTSKFNLQRENLKNLSLELKNAGINTRNLSAEQAKLNKLINIKAGLNNLRENHEKIKEYSGKMIGSLLKGGAVLGGPTVLAAQYEKELNKAVAIGNLSLSEKNAQDILYRKLGAETEYSAKEAASTGVVMSRAGFNTEQILAGLPSVLDMATANDMGLAEVASILGDAMNAFEIKANEMSRIADIMTKSANIANTSVSDLGETFKYVAPSAHILGINMETVGAMAGVLADAGLKGTMGGTGLREMLTSLSSPSEDMIKKLKSMGVYTQDADGNMLDFVMTLKQLEKATRKMGNAKRLKFLKDLAGTRGGNALANILAGVKAGKLEQKLEIVNNSEGSTAKAAGIMREGIQGAYDRLISSVQGLGLSLMQEKTRKDITSVTDSLASGLGNVSKVLNNNPILADFLTKGIAGIFGAQAVFYGGKILGLFSQNVVIMAKLIGQWTGLSSIITSIANSGAVASLMGFLTNPYVLGATAVATAGVLIYKNWDDIKKYCGELPEKFKVIGENINKNLTEPVKKYYDDVYKSCESLFNELSENLSEFYLDIKKSFDSNWKIIEDSFNSFKNNLSSSCESLYNNLNGSLSKYYLEISDNFNKSWNLIKLNFTSFYSDIENKFNSFKSILLSGFNGLGDDLRVYITQPFSNFYSILKNNLDSFKGDILNKFSNIGENIKNFINQPFGEFYDKLVLDLSKYSNFILGSFRGVGDSIKSFVNTPFDKLLDDLMMDLSKYSNFILSNFKGVGDSIKSFINMPFDEFYNNLLNNLNSYKDSIISKFNGIGDELYNFISEPFLSFYNSLNINLSDFISDSLNNFESYKNDIFKKFKNIGESLKNFINTPFSEFFKDMDVKFESFKKSFLDKFDGVFKDLWNNFVSKFEENVKKLPSNFENICNNIWLNIKSMIDEFINYLPNKMEEIKGKVSNSVRGFFKPFEDNGVKIEWKNMVGIDANASGGYIDKPEISLVGEGNSGEYIIPTESKYKNRALNLWHNAGKDLGIFDNYSPKFANSSDNNNKSFYDTLIDDIGNLAAINSVMLMSAGVSAMLKKLFSFGGGSYNGDSNIKGLLNVNNYNKNISYSPEILINCNFESGDDNIESIKKVVEDALDKSKDKFVSYVDEYFNNNARLGFNNYSNSD